eukprot:2244732-Pleurochrysis_carterae.AAC.2
MEDRVRAPMEDRVRASMEDRVRAPMEDRVRAPPAFAPTRQKQSSFALFLRDLLRAGGAAQAFIG